MAFQIVRMATLKRLPSDEFVYDHGYEVHTLHMHVHMLMHTILTHT